MFGLSWSQNFVFYKVDWSEYYHHYVRDLLGLDDNTIHQLEKDPANISRDIKVGDDDGDNDTIVFAQESLARMRAAWSEAAHTNPDSVNIDEFLGLEHPESSHSFLTQRVEELMGKVSIW